MEKKYIFLIFIVFAISLNLVSTEQDRGLTCRILEEDSKIVSGRAREYFPPDNEVTRSERFDQIDREGWEPVDSIYIDKFLTKH